MRPSQPTRHALPQFVAQACLILAGLHVPAAKAAYSEAAHDRLLAAPLASQLATLSDWLGDPSLRQSKARARVHADYLVLLVRSGQGREALRTALESGCDALPDYALDSLFIAARETKDLTAMDRIVQVLRTRAPQSPMTRLRAAQLAFDQDKLAQARSQAGAVLDDTTAPPALRAAAAELLGAVDAAHGLDFQAARAFAQALELNPGSRSARRAEILLLARRGAATKALDEALQCEAGVFTAVDLASLRQQALSQEIRWAIARRDQETGLPRIQALDRVLAHSLALLDDIGEQAQLKEVRHAVQIDRLLALNARGHDQACIDLYEALVAEGVMVPYYGLAPVAQSYSNLRRSDLSLRLYERAVDMAGENASSELYAGLFYAYLDTGRFGQADALLRQREAAISPTVRMAPEPDVPNPEYADVLDLRARYYLYTGQPDRAAAIYAALEREAALNETFTEGRVRTLAARGRPRQAAAAARAALTDQPDSFALRGALADSLLDSGSWREGNIMVCQLLADFPETPPDHPIVRGRDALYAPRLSIEAMAGKSAGPSTLTDLDLSISSTLESGLIDDQWRLFAQQTWLYGDADSAASWRYRTGLGLRWQRRGWDLSAQLHYGARDKRHTGLAATGEYQANDAITFRLGYDSNALQLPWRAYRAGVSARQLDLGLGYAANERRFFDLDYQTLDLSDGNRSHQTGLSWTEGWLRSPSAQFDTALMAAWGGNRHTEVPYYSPRSDRSLALEARYQWLTWKQDDRSLTQGISASAGTYRQSGYGSLGTFALRYEHQWRWAGGSLSYGIGVTWHPYDGQRERRTHGFLNLSIPL